LGNAALPVDFLDVDGFGAAFAVAAAFFLA
jgi:hypothetical protein